MKSPVKLDYYDFTPVLSRNCVYNFVVGARGLGKTYGAKKLVIRKAINNGEQFIYLRRYKTELTGKMTFFDDIQHEFPDYEFRVLGNVAQLCRNPYPPDGEKKTFETVGFFVSLSNAQSQKGVSFHSVTTIIFDEFIIEKGAIRYLPDETTVFNNFYSTVDRWKDKTRVIFCANSVSIMNPYFIEYEIEPDETTEFVTRGSGFMVVHFADSALFQSQVLGTRFGKFIAGTAYADYAVSSVFHDNNEFLLARKNADAKYLVTIETAHSAFAVWVDIKASPVVYYVQQGRPKVEKIWTMDASKMSEEKTFVVYSDPAIRMMRTAFKNGYVLFDGPKSRNSFLPIFSR